MKLTALNRIDRQVAQSERARVRVRALIAVVKAINEAHRNLRRLKSPTAVNPLTGDHRAMPDMTSVEAIQMMERCKQEIRDLRARVNALEPKAAAYDNLVTVLNLLPKPSQYVSEDLVWVLEKRIKELQEKPAPDNPA